MTNKFLNPYESPKLDKRSLYLRKLIVRAFEGGMRGHLGSSMSLVEILRVLYDDFLSYNPKMPEWEDRDRFILSKGHGCLAQYALLSDKGFISVDELDKFCHHNGILGGHPEKNKIPGVEFSTGALGHGLPVAVGMALAAKIKNKKHKIFLGNINSKRDWGHAKDYVDAMWKMLQQNKPQDFVIGTGKLHSVKDFLKIKIDGYIYEIPNYLIHRKIPKDYKNLLIRKSLYFTRQVMLNKFLFRLRLNPGI